MPTINGIPISNTDSAANLILNPDFETAIPLSDFTTTINWREVDGNTPGRSVQTITDGPGGTTTKVMQVYSVTGMVGAPSKGSRRKS